MRKGRLVPLALAGAQGQLQFEDAPLDSSPGFKDRKYVPAKVRALVDYLLQELPQQPVLR